MPNGTFWDDEFENDELMLEVTGMPSWLSFDAALQTFVGVPLRSTTEFPDVVDVNITANKSCLLSNTTTLSISVDALVEEDPTLTVEMKWLLPLPQAQRRRRQSEFGSNCANVVDGFVRASILEAVAAQGQVSVAALRFDIIDASIVPDATRGSVCQCSAMVMENGPITCAQARSERPLVRKFASIKNSNKGKSESGSWARQV